MAAEILAPMMCEFYGSHNGLLGFGDPLELYLPRRNPSMEDTFGLAGFLDEILHDVISPDDSDMDSDEEVCFCPSERGCSVDGFAGNSCCKPDSHDTDCAGCCGQNEDRRPADVSDEPSEGVSKSPVNQDVVAADKSARNFHAQFNLSGFSPSEISVNIKDDKYIDVHARHEESSENGHEYQEFHQVISVPSHVDPQSIKSALSTDGMLTVQAEVKKEALGDSDKSLTKTLKISHE